MNTEELKQLRSQIMNDILPLVIESEGDSNRFEILISIIQTGGASLEIYKKAYESAKKIEDVDQRLEASIALVNEIDFQVESTQDTESLSEQSNEEPQQ